MDYNDWYKQYSLEELKEQYKNKQIDLNNLCNKYEKEKDDLQWQIYYINERIKELNETMI